MGAAAKSPESNMKPPNTTLPSNQVGKIQPPPQAPNLQQNAMSNSKVQTDAFGSAPQGTPNQYSGMVTDQNGNTRNYNGTPLIGTQQTPVPQNYGGIMGALIQNSQQGSPSVQSAQQGIVGAANQNPLQSGGAYDAYSKAVQSQTDLKNQIAAKYGAIEQQPIDMNFQQGREQVLARQYASQLDAASQGVTQAQQALGYGIQEQGQKISGLNQAGSLGNTQQQIQQQGYSNAINSIPEALRFGGAGGGNLDPNTQAQTLAQDFLSGRKSYNDAAAGMAYAGAAGQTFLNNAIHALNPNANIAQLQGQYAANQQNTQTAGTAVTSANAAAYSQNLNPYLQLQNTVQNVDQFGSLLLKTMQDGGINPYDVKYGNQTLANVRSQLSSQQQAVFDNTYASLKSRVSGLLATGGSEIPTQITSDANKVLDGSLPLSSLSAVLTRISSEGKILLNNQANLVNAPLQTAGGSSSGKVGTPQSDYDAYLQSIGAK